MKRAFMIALAAALLCAWPSTVAAQQAPTNYPGCVYLATPGTLADKQTAILNCDQLKNLKIAGGTGTPMQADTIVTGSASSAAVLTNWPVDLSGYGSISLQVLSAGAGNSITYEESADNSTWVGGLMSFNNASSGNFPSQSTSVALGNTLVIQPGMRFGRIRVSSYGSGTVTIAAHLRAQPPAFEIAGAVGLAGDASAVSGNPIAAGGRFETTPPTFSNGQRVEMRFTNRGELLVQPSSGASPQTFNASPADTVSNTATVTQNLSKGYVYNGTDWDRQRAALNGFNAATGITAAAQIGQCDDTTPVTITENNFGNVRINCTEHTLSVAGQCNNTAQATVTAGNTTAVIALSGSTVVRVCAMHVGMATTGTYSVVRGAGANCATSPTTLIPATNLTAGNVVPYGNGVGVLYRGASGEGICVTAVTGNVQVQMTYAQY